MFIFSIKVMTRVILAANDLVIPFNLWAFKADGDSDVGDIVMLVT